MAQKLFATSLLTACLATTMLAANTAHANNAGLHFYPKSKWTVEQVSADKDNNICTLSNQLNNGYIIQLAGTSRGFTNLNIDFRQDSFEKNKKYEVKYSVPGAIEKTIPTKAFKENLLVSDLRKESDFSEALQTASVLDVQIRETKFRIYMTGLAASMDKYTNCITPQPEMVDIKDNNKPSDVAAANIPQQPKEIKSAHAPPPPNITTDMPNNNAQQKTNDDAVIPAHKLRPAPSDRPRYTQQLAEQLKEESKKFKPNSAANPADEQRVVEKIEPEASMFTAGKGDIKTSELEINQNSKIQKPHQKNITHENYTTPEPVYNITKLERISVDLTNAAHNKSNEIKIANTDNTNDIASSLALIEPTSGRNNDDDFIIMRNKVSELEKMIGVLTSKNTMLDEELKIVLKDSENEKVSISSDNWNLERATMKFNEAERQIMRLGRQLQTHKAQCSQEKASLEHMLFDPELTNQQQLASLSSLETELDKAKSDLYRQQRQYEERIRLLEKQLDAQ